MKPILSPFSVLVQNSVIYIRSPPQQGCLRWGGQGGNCPSCPFQGRTYFSAKVLIMCPQEEPCPPCPRCGQAFLRLKTHWQLLCDFGFECPAICDDVMKISLDVYWEQCVLITGSGPNSELKWTWAVCYCQENEHSFTRGSHGTWKLGKMSSF